MGEQVNDIDISKLYFNANDIIRKIGNETMMPLLFWHYTNINGFEGIINGNNTISFWFTRSDCLNDNSEGVHIIKIYQKILDKLCDENYISEDVYNILKSINPADKKLVPFPIPKDEDGVSSTMIDIQDCDVYICCFSTNSDSLDMWRYYAETKNGYAIGVHRDLFNEYINYPFSACDKKRDFANLEAFRVIYDTKTKESIMEQLIKKACIVFEKYSFDEKVKHLASYVEYVLTNLRYRFKHECFSSENEYRFVFYRPRKKPEKLIGDLPKVEYRAQNGIMIPYLILRVAKAWIWEVKLSPYIKEDNSIEVTKGYLKSKGYSSIRVTHSELPVR